MAEERSEIKRGILIRVRWLYIAFFLTGVAIIARILYIQNGPESAELKKSAARITYERRTIEADRGDVLAVDGRILATSVPMFEIRMDFAAQGIVDSVFDRNVDSLAICLASFFGDKSSGAYRTMLRNMRRNKTANRYALISPRRVNYLEKNTISRFPLFRLGANKGGFIPVQINKRLYPHGSLARRTIGIVNEDGVRVGVEGAFDHELRGKDGNVLMQRVSGSFKVPVPDDENVDPIDGIDVVTTLDVDIQDVAETALRHQLELGDADWGSVVLMEVETGEIRAMANLTRKGEGKYVEDFNYAIGMNLEPGSTFKLASLITLLEDGGMSLTDTIDMGSGTAMVGRVKVVDTHGYGVGSLRRVFEVSSNIGFAKAVNSVYADDPKRFVDFICKMGMDKPLGIQIPGEATPQIKHPGDRWWDGMTLTMMSYGYALRVTPMKTLALFNAVANGGKMISPLLVKELRQYGQTIRTFRSEVINPSICSKRTLADVQSCLEGVVDEGTARYALKNPYYKVAGKTGTAQIAMGRGGYIDARGGRHYLASLVGYFPAEAPKYSCIVVIKTYHGPGRRGTYYGASLAGPVFRAIADRVYAQSTDWQPVLSDVKGEKDEQPLLKGGRTAEIRTVADKLSIPLVGMRQARDWSAVIEDDSVGVMLQSVEVDGRVPDVRGMGLKEAIYLMEKNGVTVTFSGQGRVVSQSVKAGTKPYRGMVVALQLEVKD